eukprot:3754-Heterococcus_DN1.PRE.1
MTHKRIFALSYAVSYESLHQVTEQATIIHASTVCTSSCAQRICYSVSDAGNAIHSGMSMLLAHFNKLACQSLLYLLDAVLNAVMQQQTAIAQHSHSTQDATNWLIALLNLGFIVCCEGFVRRARGTALGRLSGLNHFVHGNLLQKRLMGLLSLLVAQLTALRTGKSKALRVHTTYKYTCTRCCGCCCCLLSSSLSTSAGLSMLLVAVTVILCLSQRNCTVVMVTVSGLWLTVTSARVLALSSATLPVPPTTAPAAAGAVAVTLKDSSIGATTLVSRVGAVKVIVEVRLVVVADALGVCCLMLTPAGTVHLNSALAVLVAVMLTVAAPVVDSVVVAAAARADN